MAARMKDAPLKRTLFSLARHSYCSCTDQRSCANGSDRPGQQGLDAIAVGVYVFIVSYAEVRAVNARRQRLLREVSKIAELNHQVRNALQSIRYAAHLGTEGEYVEVIEENVKRIDSVLRPLSRLWWSPRSQPFECTNNLR
jgi:hypothetical protein